MSDSIREALTAAYEKAESAPPAAESTEASPAEPVSTASAADSGDAPAASDSGSGTTTDASNTPPDAAASAAAPAKPAESAPPAATSSEANAPISWTAEERTAWTGVPEAARKAIARREGEMNRALQYSATARRRVEALDRAVETFKPLLDQYGVTVEQVIPNLLSTRAALEVGTPQQKATLVANICAEFGLDVNLLDAALATRYQNGQPPPRQQAPAPDLSNNPQLAPLFALAAQYKEAQNARAATAIAEVSADPLYNEVRFTMADLIETAKARGQTMDLKTALGIAKQMHGHAPPAPPAPSVSDAARTLAAARNAASSVSGAPKPTPPRKPGEGSVRDELLANFAAARR